MKLTARQWRMFPLIQRKYPVSVHFLKSNMANIKKFVWNALCPRAVIRRVLKRKRREQRVFIDYYHLQRVQWDLGWRKQIKQRKRNVQQWTKLMVRYLRNTNGVQEYVEDGEKCSMPPEEVSKQLKEQLQLLRSGKRTVPLMMLENPGGDDHANATSAEKMQEVVLSNEEEEKSVTEIVESQQELPKDSAPACKVNENKRNPASTSIEAEQTQFDIEAELADATLMSPSGRVTNSTRKCAEIDPPIPASTAFKKITVGASERVGGGSWNFLDMLMSKVRVNSINNEAEATLCQMELHEENSTTAPSSIRDVILHEQEHLTDSSDEFLGFEETERVPGMMMTPLVPQRANAAFVSESLNAYMRDNELETTTSPESNAADGAEASAYKFREANYDGLVTPACKLPHLDMPAVPENLQKLRTVAERRHYLQKFSKNHKLAIINNEAMIYRELQRKLRLHKSKSVSQQLLHAANSQMPFTRDGWLAASFVTTEYNKYYYQMLDVDNGREYVKLRCVRGNNEERSKRPYTSFAPTPRQQQETAACIAAQCCDRLAWRDFKSIRTLGSKAKLNREFLPASLFPPCPLSHKPYQKPLDDEAAALLLAGGSMAVVRMPTVELQVFPELGKPLHEIAKRYLQYILPHHDISREWAEFSVSTLQQPHTMKEAEVAAANVIKRRRRGSFTFAIPYLNDRNHILVRRVVDRSEQLDQSFTQTSENDTVTTAAPVADLTFRANLDKNDAFLMDCADVVSDMINCVAISCSENSFIKEDPDNIYGDKHMEIGSSTKVKEPADKPTTKEAALKIEDKTASIIQALQLKKQHRMLLELKRLNATIIDAGVKTEKEAKPCGKEYCALGCVCTSLVDAVPLRQHCGKSKCIIECTCKGSGQPSIMRLETDGRSITTEDAYMLRRKATARLARMEKEFTSTIVLTENETLLINESQYDKKRRCTKAPKRYEDFADTDDDFSRTSPLKNPSSSAVLSIDASDSPASNLGFAETATELREPVYVKDTTLRQLKHCTVSLVRFQDTKNMVNWCMVHELYKCFCGGRATEGKPLHIEKEEINATTMHNTNGVTEEYVLAPTKARYSFEKMEDVASKGIVSPVPAVEESEKQEEDEEEEEDEEQEEEDEEYISPLHAHEDVAVYIADDSEVSSDDDYCSGTSTSLRKKRHDSLKQENKQKRDKRGRPSEEAITRSYYSACPQSCRRVVPLPKKCYLRMNRKRKPLVIEQIERNENAKTRLLLNEHILRSVYYHKRELEKQLRVECAAEPANEQTPRKRVVEVCKQQQETKEPHAGLKHAVEPQETPAAAQKVVDLIDADSRQSSSNSTTSNSLCRRKERLKRAANISIPLESQSTADSCSVASEDTEQQRTELGESERKRAKLVSNKEQSVKSAATAFVDLTENANIEASDSPESGVCVAAAGPADKCSGSQTSTTSSPATSSRSHVSAVESNAASQRSTAADLGLNEVTISSDSFKDFYNGVIKNMNNLVSKKMQDIDMALKRESKIIPAPNDEILCIIKWTNFLDAFSEGYVFIWEVKMQAHTFLAATVANMMPMVLGALGVINTAAINDSSKLPLMARMLRNAVRTEQTQRLAIVMQGRASYWMVRGFLRPDSASACAKPTPQTHPLLTKKINMLCSLLVKQRIKDFKRKQHANAARLCQNRPIQARPISAVEQARAERNKRSAEGSGTPLAANKQTLLAKRREQRLKSKAPAALKQLPQTQSKSHTNVLTSQLEANHHITTPTPATDTLTTSSNSDRPTHSSSNAQLLRNLSSQERYANMKTNIEFRKVNTEDIDEIHPPECHSEDHRWLVLDLCNDFSHIFVPDFRDLVSLDRIQKVMTFSKQKQKIVKLQFFLNAPFDAFVTPSSARKIYFGPLKLNMRPPLLILLQSVDGQMMLREVYQQEHNILSRADERTTAFWILQINGQIHFEIDSEPQLREQQQQSIRDSGRMSTLRPLILPATVAAELESESNEQAAAVKADSDEDDCMIVEDHTVGERRSSEDIGQLEPILDEDSHAPTVAEEKSARLLGAHTDVPSMRLTVADPNVIKQVYGPAVASAAAATTPISTAQQTGAVFLESAVSTSTMTLISAGQRLFAPAYTHSNGAPTEAAAPRQNISIHAQDNSSQLQLTAISSGTAENSVLPLATTQTITAPVLQFPTVALQSSAGFMPLMSIQSPGILTSIAEAPKEAPYGATVYISQQQPLAAGATADTAAVVKEITAVTTALQMPKTSSTQQLAEPSTVACNRSTVQTQTSQMASAAEHSLGLLKRRRISMRGGKPSTVSMQMPAPVAPSAQRQTAILCEVSGVIKLTNEMETAKPAAVSTIGSTTITKLVCANAPQPQPLVFDVNIMDAVDEPTASIVIKPPTAMDANITTAPAIRTTSTINLAATGSLSVTRNSAPPVKRTVSGTLKTATATTVTIKKSSTCTTASTAQATQKVIMSAAALNSSKNFRGVTTTSLNFHKTENKVLTKPPLKTFRPSTVEVSCASSTATSPKVLHLQMQSKQQSEPKSLPKPMPRQSLPVSTSICAHSKAVKPIINLRAAVPLPQRHSLPASTTVRYKLKSDVNGGRDAATSSIKAKPTATQANNVSISSPSMSGQSQRPAQQEYGFFCCSVLGAPKFIAKRLAEHFLVKVPPVGTLQIQNIESVNLYLNRHLINNKEPKLLGKLPTTWKFLPQERPKIPKRKESALPIATIGAISTKSSSLSAVSNATATGKFLIDGQRNLKIRKVIVQTKQLTGNKTNVPLTAASTTANSLNSFHDETILIED